MDIQALLQPFFTNAAVFLGGTGLVAATVAQMVYAALNQVGFEPAKAADQLGKLGFKIGQALLPELTEVAKTGIKGLTKWFEAKLASSVEVNEAATSVLIEQAEPLAKAVDEGVPHEKESVADEMQKGLQAYGGAMIEIAESYAAVIKDLSQLQELVEDMQQKVEAWANQTVEAKRGSLIENVEQTIEGGAGGKQEIRAEDDSIISGVKQVIKGKPKSG
jgi:hypothetical protein